MVAPLLCLMGIGEKEMLEGLREQHAGEQQNDATLPADDPAGEAPVALLHRQAGLEDALAPVLHLIARLAPALAAAVLVAVDLLVRQRRLLLGDEIFRRHLRPPDRWKPEEQPAPPPPFGPEERIEGNECVRTCES